MVTFREDFVVLGKGVMVTLLICMLASCAPHGGSRLVVVGDEVESKVPSGLLERFSTYWEKRIAGDVSATYDMELPLFRDRITLEQYKTYTKVFSVSSATSVEVNNGGCEDEEASCCCVLAAVELSAGEGGSGEERYMKDCWMKVDGEWSHLVFNPILLPSVSFTCFVSF